MERLLTGLAGQGIDVTVMGHHRPPRGWANDHLIGWRYGPERADGRAVVRQARARDARTAAGTVWSLAHGALTSSDRTTRMGAVRGFDVIYAPWINTLTDHEHLLAAGVPVVTSCRGSLITSAPLNPKRGAHRAALPRVFAGSTLVHCVSDRIVLDATALGLDPSKARVIRPAVDPDRFPLHAPRGDAAGPLRVLAVGGLNWPKDQEHALLTVRKAIDLGVDVRLDIIGEGPERQHLLFAIDDLDLSAHARLLGRRSPREVGDELAASDAFLHTSSSEGISNAVLEAMATGLPVISTDAGGMREAIDDGVDGFLVPVRDADAAAARLALLAADGGQRERLGTAARARILADFRLTDQVAAFAALLAEAAAS